MGYKRGAGEVGWGTVGLEATVLIVNFGFEIDLIKFFKGVFGAPGRGPGAPPSFGGCP